VSDTAVQEPLTEDDNLPDDLDSEEEKKGGTSIREYIVFKAGTATTWQEVEKVNAGSAEAAIKSVHKGQAGSTKYAACPSRNWTAGTLGVETHTTVTFTAE
jgi:hypothetical protein